jgi:hypothetical protein
MGMLVSFFWFIIFHWMEGGMIRSWLGGHLGVGAVGGFCAIGHFFVGGATVWAFPSVSAEAFKVT